jgi:hypothetical protein
MTAQLTALADAKKLSQKALIGLDGEAKAGKTIDLEALARDAEAALIGDDVWGRYVVGSECYERSLIEKETLRILASVNTSSMNSSARYKAKRAAEREATKLVKSMDHSGGSVVVAKTSRKVKGAKAAPPAEEKRKEKGASPADEQRVRDAEAARLAEEKRVREAAEAEVARLAEEKRLREAAEAEAARLAEEKRVHEAAEAEAARLAEEKQLALAGANRVALALEERDRLVGAAHAAELERTQVTWFGYGIGAGFTTGLTFAAVVALVLTRMR